MKNKKQIADFSLRVVRHFAGSNNAGSYEHAADFRGIKTIQNGDVWRQKTKKLKYQNGLRFIKEWKVGLRERYLDPF